MCATQVSEGWDNSINNFKQGNFMESLDPWGIQKKPLGGLAAAVAPKAVKKVNKGLQGIKDTQTNALKQIGSAGVAHLS